MIEKNLPRGISGSKRSVDNFVRPSLQNNAESLDLKG